MSEVLLVIIAIVSAISDFFSWLIELISDAYQSVSESISGIIQKRQVKKHRKKMRNRWSKNCDFSECVTEAEFQAIVAKAERKIKRVTLKTYGPIVIGEVTSQTGLSSWSFKISFNDEGSITGTYWIITENDDSNIPNKVADIIKNEIDIIWNE